MPRVFASLLLAATVVAVTSAAPITKVEKVAVGYYMESLCPYCIQFIERQLSPALKQGLGDIMDLSIVPYGNARGTGKSIQCQHGSEECQGNMIESCLISLNPEVKSYFPAFSCMEQSGDPVANAQRCVQEAGLDWSSIQSCVNSEEGIKFEDKMAKRTNELQPPHKYVPWVVVNGSPIGEDLDNFVKLVCNAYTGTNKPEACSSSFAALDARKTAKKVSVGYYMESLCPDCIDFVEQTLAPAIENGLGQIMDLNVVPYGNARGTGKSTHCQHGTQECIGNMIETCMIHLNPEVKDYFPAFKCMEQSGRPVDDAESCIKKAGLDYDAINNCANSNLGQQLEDQMAKETMALQPAHTYVPWVVVDGQPLYNDLTELTKRVCDAYSGSDKPAVCGN